MKKQTTITVQELLETLKYYNKEFGTNLIRFMVTNWTIAEITVVWSSNDMLSTNVNEFIQKLNIASQRAIGFNSLQLRVVCE